MKQLTPNQYFDSIKSLKNENTDESLDAFYDAALSLLKKYKALNQITMIKKLMFIVNTIPKERELLKRNINIFIYKDDIEEYINDVKNKAVKIIELERYPREIPDELIPIVNETRNIFDRFYVLFTDYTGKVERQVEKERREKDPILFGVFAKNNDMSDRWYYLGDWIDEYCDLTLEKLISEQSKNIINVINTPLNKDELIEECQRLIENKEDNGWQIHSSNSQTVQFVNGSPQVVEKHKKSLFSKVTAIFRR